MKINSLYNLGKVRSVGRDGLKLNHLEIKLVLDEKV